MTSLVGELVVDMGADYVGIRIVNGEVERFDVAVIRWSPFAPLPWAAAKHPRLGRRRADLPKPRQIGR